MLYVRKTKIQKSLKNKQSRFFHFFKIYKKPVHIKSKKIK